MDNNDQIDETNRESLKRLQKVPGNSECADCQAPNPEWACTNLGIIVCIECSGIHRSLGVHVSKVRSVILDKWESEAIEVSVIQFCFCFLLLFIDQLQNRSCCDWGMLLVIASMRKLCLLIWKHLESILIAIGSFHSNDKSHQTKLLL
jgi:hypothetical protein